MSRYVYKPLNTYLKDDKSLDEFLEFYKESLNSGELFVDLKEYDIYISNNGIEYPIPTTKDLREKIINWLESDDNPLTVLTKFTTENEGVNEIESKLNNIENLMKEINTHQIDVSLVNDVENSYRKINHEVKYFYQDLTNYINNRIQKNSVLEDKLNDILSNVIQRYINTSTKLEKMLLKFFEKRENFKREMDILNKNIYNNMNLIDIINEHEESKLKLDSSYLDCIPPNINIKITADYNNSSGYVKFEDITSRANEIYHNIHESMYNRSSSRVKCKDVVNNIVDYSVYLIEDDGNGNEKEIIIINRQFTNRNLEDKISGSKLRFVYEINSNLTES